MRIVWRIAPWVILLSVGLYLWRQSGQLREARAGEERQRAIAAGLIVASQQTQVALDRSVAPQLSPQIERVQTVIPGARVESHVTASTVPAPVAPLGAPGDCLLRPGDRARVDVSIATLRGPQGTQVVVGEARALRLDLTGPVVLFGGPFEAPLTQAVELAPASPPGWGLGLVGDCGSAGCVLGGALSPPPVRVPWIGGQLEFIGAATLRPSATLTVLYRR